MPGQPQLPAPCVPEGSPGGGGATLTPPPTRGGIADLAQTKVLEDAAFVRFLEYLLYWRQPEYAQYLIFPQAVFFLGLLQHRGFRDALVDPATIDWLHRQQYFDWLDSKAQELHRTLDAAGADGEGGGDGGEAER